MMRTPSADFVRGRHEGTRHAERCWQARLAPGEGRSTKALFEFGCISMSAHLDRTGDIAAADAAVTARHHEHWLPNPDGVSLPRRREQDSPAALG